MNFETIKFELQENGIGIITLNRPDRLNAISFQLVEDFHAVLDQLMVNLDCRIVILKGEGRAFCTGLDLNDLEFLISPKVPENAAKYYYLQSKEATKKRLYYQNRMAQIVIKLRKINQPVIALIQGPAVGGGFTFAMASDIRYAGPNAKFGIGAINVGMSGGDLGGSYFLPRQLGLALAGELMLTGRFMEAAEAERTGFVLKVVEDSKLMDTAMDMAKLMLKKNPLGIRFTKEVINVSWDAPSLETIVHFDNRAQIICGSSKDLKEKMKAAAEKRKPEFPLR